MRSEGDMSYRFGRLGVPAVLSAIAVTAGFAAVAGAASPRQHSASAASGKGTLLMEIELRSNPSDALMAGGFSVECKKLGYTCEVVGALNTLDVPSSNAL